MIWESCGALTQTWEMLEVIMSGRPYRFSCSWITHAGGCAGSCAKSWPWLHPTAFTAWPALAQPTNPNLWDRDRDYVSVLSTREQPTGRRYSRRYDQTLYPASKVEHLASRLMGRTFQWLRSGRLDESIEVCRRAVCETFHSGAAGDQYGILIAGAHVLASNEPPTIQGLRPWLQRHHRAT